MSSYVNNLCLDRLMRSSNSKHLWVVMRTQSDHKLQTLIEVWSDFCSLELLRHLHCPVWTVFAMESTSRLTEVFIVEHAGGWILPKIILLSRPY